jgi:trehalose 6-phosphate phosphatase
LTAIDDALSRVRSGLSRAAIFTDFDGTLSTIVDWPDDAVLVDGAEPVVRQLAEEAGLFAVVSGRPISYLERRLPAGPVLSGLYGLEVLRDGERHDHPQAGAWREVVTDVHATSEAVGPEGMVVESKGLSLTLHYRAEPGLAMAVQDWAQRQADRSGLVIRPAKMSVELHPPLATDKGTVVLDMVDALDPVVFIGDDRGDLAAFAALVDLATRGRTVVRIAVASSEAPREIIEQADLVVDDPAGALVVLRGFLGQDTSAS